MLNDPIAMEVFTNRLLSITEDMNNTLVRSSFSTNIKERRDCSVALFDGRGRLIAPGHADSAPLGSLSGGVAAVLRAYPVEKMRDGDAFISNDPYLANGNHLPDITIVTPVFFEGRIEFFAANIGHHADVGGSVPGSIAGGSRSIFEEGIRIPVVRIVRAGELDDGVLNLITCNTRDPEERSLDLKVQIATNERGAAAARELSRQMGIEAVRQSVEDVIEYTRRRIRKRVAQLAGGEYSFTNHLDDDGMGGDPVPITVTVRVAGDTLSVDFTGTGAQARGAMNIPLNAPRSERLLLRESAARSGSSTQCGTLRRGEDTRARGHHRQSAGPGGSGARARSPARRWRARSSARSAACCRGRR
jgi:N-methylhydantoinase B